MMHYSSVFRNRSETSHIKVASLNISEGDGLFMQKYFQFVVVLMMSVILVACAPQATVTTITSVPSDWVGMTAPPEMDADAGWQLYSTYCQSCHGSKGAGDGPAGTSLVPSPSNLAVLAPQVGDDYLFWRISTGVEGTSMPAWGNILTDEEIWQLVAFIRTLD